MSCTPQSQQLLSLRAASQETGVRGVDGPGANILDIVVVRHQLVMYTTKLVTRGVKRIFVREVGG